MCYARLKSYLRFCEPVCPNACLYVYAALATPITSCYGKKCQNKKSGRVSVNNSNVYCKALTNFHRLLSPWVSVLIHANNVDRSVLQLDSNLNANRYFMARFVSYSSILRHMMIYVCTVNGLFWPSLFIIVLVFVLFFSFFILRCTFEHSGGMCNVTFFFFFRFAGCECTKDHDCSLDCVTSCIIPVHILLLWQLTIFSLTSLPLPPFLTQVDVSV